MSKVIINMMLKSDVQDEHINEKNAILNGNKIYFNIDDVNSIITLKDNKVIIERKSEDYDILLEFENGKKHDGKYLVKSLNTNMKICTETKKLSIKENSIYLEYTVYVNDVLSDNIIYELNWRC